MTVTLEFIPTNGITLHTALAGPEDGEPVILLHGFPDAWFGWEPQIQALAAAGFRVAAPDQRGYNLSDKPAQVAGYTLDVLAADVIGLADALGFDRFCLVGHDFGALVSWRLAELQPERLKRLVIANVPHPAVMRRYMRKHLSQLRKSWYAFFFQIPVLPERVLRANNWQRLSSQMEEGFSREQLDRYRAAWSQPGAIKAMLNWYRALMRPSASRAVSAARITVPALIVWGKQDRHISYEMAQLSAEVCTECRLVMLEEATHWVHQDRPDEVSRLLIEHLQGDAI